MFSQPIFYFSFCLSYIFALAPSTFYAIYHIGAVACYVVFARHSTFVVVYFSPCVQYGTVYAILFVAFIIFLPSTIL